MLTVRGQTMLGYIAQACFKVQQATATDNGQRMCWVLRSTSMPIPVDAISMTSAPVNTYTWDLLRLQFDLQIWKESRDQYRARFVRKPTPQYEIDVQQAEAYRQEAGVAGKRYKNMVGGSSVRSF